MAIPLIIQKNERKKKYLKIVIDSLLSYKYNNFL